MSELEGSIVEPTSKGAEGMISFSAVFRFLCIREGEGLLRSVVVRFDMADVDLCETQTSCAGDLVYSLYALKGNRAESAENV